MALPTLTLCRRAGARAAFALALLLLAARAGSAFTFVPVADEALVDRAPVAALVEVVEVRPAARTTRVRARPLAVLKGKVAEREIELLVPGGGEGGRETAVTGAPRFAAGERALLFLEPLVGGGYRLHQLGLGAFHEVSLEGKRYAWRDLAGARTWTTDPAGRLSEAAASDPWRDFDAFVRFVGERARGGRPRVDYLAAPPGAAAKRGGEAGAARWFEFDQGGHVPFRMRGAEPPGLSGVATAFAAALAAWNDDPDTAVDLRYAGHAGGFGPPGTDGESALLLGDPEGLLTPFNCAYGGVVALTLPTSEPAAEPFRGNVARRLVEADIVLNRGIDCFFALNGAPDAAVRELLAHEVGHALGLGHSCGDATSGPCVPGSARDQALLRAQLHNDGRGAALAQEDRLALAALYGSAAPPAAPTALAAHARTVGAIALSWQDNARGEQGYAIEARELVSGRFVPVGAAPAEANGWVITGLAPETGYVFRVRALGAAGDSPYSNEALAATSGAAGPCLPDDRSLCLNRGRFRVRARFASAAGTGAAGTGPAAGDESGLFWFFSPGNWELALKVLDGCGANGHYWVFFAALTRVEHSVTVTDTWTGRTRAYWSAAGALAPPVTDVEALAVCP